MMTHRQRHWAAAAAAIGLLAIPALTAYAAVFSAWEEPVNLGANVNSSATDNCAFETKSGLSLYFGSNRIGGQGGYDLYVSQRASSDEAWGPAQNLGAVVNTASDDACPVILPGEREMIFYSTRPGGAGGRDLYIATRRDKRDDFGWGAAENLGTVNTLADEMYPTVFEDEDLTLYFSSNRAGGLGMSDVWMSTRGEDDDAFGAVVHVPELSSAANEALLSVRRDGRQIFVASNRPGTLGPQNPDVPAASTDLWVATRHSTQGAWSTPVNSGPALETAGGGSLNTYGQGESGGALSRDGTVIYITSTRAGGQGGIDLWMASREKTHGHGHGHDD